MTSRQAVQSSHDIGESQPECTGEDEGGQGQEAERGRLRRNRVEKVWGRD